LLKIVSMTKEKCLRNGQRPTHTVCAQCLSSRIAIKQFSERGELCLPRIMGIAIGKGFDGIHHGHEIADVKYVDVFAKTLESVSLGIHLKSRQPPKPQGLGRSVGSIKALYTQIFYSAYLTLKGNADFDVIGLSIPNEVRQEVITSIESLLDQLGFSLLVIDEQEWVKIVDAAIEQLSF
ncbi:MAG: hypothetical protein KC519_05105, partial [Anaerolineae bacterium]|nr:hypothetical protein [Anaerolineae bacterium]